MLAEFRIRNLGVIEDATMALGPGLTVLTGETGAGKTMVVSGLGLLLGARADASLVRAGQQRLSVEGVLEPPIPESVLARIADAGGEPASEASDDIILLRTVSAEGRSRAHVSGHAAPVSVLSQIADDLVAVHGQSDQQRLRRADQHRDVLDAYGGQPHDELLKHFQHLWDRRREIDQRIAELETSATERLRQADALRYGLSQIEQLEPVAGEDVDLAIEAVRLENSEQLRAAASAATDHLSGDEDSSVQVSALHQIAAARQALSMTESDPALAELSGRLVDASHVINDVVTELGSYVQDIDGDPARLEHVQQRRAALRELTRRYGSTIDDVLAWQAQAYVTLEEVDGGDAELLDLRARATVLAAELDAAAATLTQSRERLARELTDAVTGELAALAMDKARITVQLTERGSLSRSGGDDVDFLLQANPGSKPVSVAKAASGGELSRVMLALELATAEAQGSRPTLVFDEIDAGIGGHAALAVGARLAELARGVQVIVVTHLAQVAAYADRHLVVAKSSDGAITATDVAEVCGDAREAELARMMSGHDTDSARIHARELLDEAERRSQVRQ